MTAARSGQRRDTPLFGLGAHEELSTTLDLGGQRATPRAVGEIDIASAGALLEVGKEALAARPVFLDPDLTGITFIDVRGVATLMTLQRDAAIRGTDLHLHVSARVQHVLEAMRVLERFKTTVVD